MTNKSNHITFIDTETTQLDGRVCLTEYGEVPDVKNFDNQKILLRIKPNSSSLMTPEAILVQKTSLEDLKSPDRVSDYEGAKFINKRLKLIDSPILAIHNSKFDLNVLNQNGHVNLFSPHRTSNKLIYDTLDLHAAAICLRPSKLQYINEEAGKHSLSLNIISKELLNEEEKHQADEDCITGIKTKAKVDEIAPEIDSLVKFISIDANRYALFDSPLLMRPTLSPTNGPSSQLISRLTSFDWSNWDVMLGIPDEFSWEGNTIELSNKLKEITKPSVMKTKRIAILFPNSSNTFKKHYPNYPDKKIQEVINLLRQDRVFIDKKKEELRVKYSKPKERKFNDIFHNEDGFPSPNDNYISILFHEGDPKTKYELCNQFEDHRLSTNSKIIMLHNFRDVMTNRDIQDVLDYEISELEKPEASRVTFESFMKSYDKVCSDPKWSKHDLTNLNEYKAHVLALKANPKLLLEE